MTVAWITDITKKIYKFMLSASRFFFPSSLSLFTKVASKTLQGERAVRGQVHGPELIQVMRTGFVEHQGSN